MNKLFELFRRKKQADIISEGKMSHAIREWTKLYENSGGNSDGSNINIASAISSEMARLVTLEMKSQVFGSERAEYINKQYQRVIEKARMFSEYACAKGGVVLKPYLENNKIMVNIIQADAFMPTSFTSDGEITGAIFYDTFFDDGFYYTRVEEHRLINNCVTIKNTAYKSKSYDEAGEEIPLVSVAKWSGIEPFCRINNLDRPLFCYFKMPMANTVDTASPLGVSVFSRAVGLIKDAYTQYNNLLWEFESGKRALYIDECAVLRDEEGHIKIPDKRLYKLLSTGDDNLFKDWSPELREENILRGLDRILRSIEFNCGLAYGTLSDVSNQEKTAEEIRASKQRSYATIRDIQKSLEKTLFELVNIMQVYCDMYSIVPEGECCVNFDFDDSVICDRKDEFDERMQLLANDVIDKTEMLSWYFGDKMVSSKRKGENNEI